MCCLGRARQPGSRSRLCAPPRARPSVAPLPSGPATGSPFGTLPRSSWASLLRRWSARRCAVAQLLDRGPGPRRVEWTTAFDSGARRNRSQRRVWDLNPRWLAPHTLSKRADSAALATLLEPERLPWAVARSRRWRSGPVQSWPVNRVRAGRQQLSAVTAVCRRSPGRHLWERADPGSERSIGRVDFDGLPVPLPALPVASLQRGEGAGPGHPGPAQRGPGGPGGPRLPVQRPAGHRQDLDRPHPGQGAQLHEPPGRRAVLRVRVVPGHRGRRGPTTSRSSTPPRTTRSRTSATSSSGWRSGRPAARRCTSSTRSTCSRAIRRMSENIELHAFSARIPPGGLHRHPPTSRPTQPGEKPCRPQPSMRSSNPCAP